MASMENGDLGKGKAPNLSGIVSELKGVGMAKPGDAVSPKAYQNDASGKKAKTFGSKPGK